MLAKINPKPLSGTVPAISSKSMAHRIIIAAALANGVIQIDGASHYHRGCPRERRDPRRL